MTSSHRRFQVIAALLAVWVLWGSTFLGIRVMVGAAPPLFAAGVRFTAAGAILLTAVAWAARRRNRHSTPDGHGPGVRERLRGRAGRFALLGVLHFLCANGLVSVAEQRLPSAAAGVCFATVPLWTLLLRAVTGGRPTAADLAVVACGLGGVALLLGFQAGPLLPSLQVLAAAAVWALAGHLAARPDRAAGPPAGPALSSAVQMVSGGLALLTASAVGGEWSRIRPEALTSVSFWLAGAHLVLLGSLVGFWAYIWLVTKVDQRLAGTYAYVNPVVAVLLGWLLLGERLPTGALLGTALVTAAVAWTVLSQGARRDRPAKSSPPIPLTQTTKANT
ncbi:drug/metabolite transporter (DMT)-like permease [Kitasatospora gansuensis]|uniref:Drug/metabolite transporter (DMT)-like permease n=1 Tax=Kitasatospora gansuensis TaxID=258050 RepID=A0A7W7WI91_9ACTN|nr:EamA family transporter [Kitasatospora gansuensis]MBB4948016.1 drug/metabolite transporter (DMT)-like permease [Kitasatospora gansuensis]